MLKRFENSHFAPLAVGIFIGAVTVSTAVLLWNHDHEPRRHSAPHAAEADATPTLPPVLASTASPSMDPAVARVAARFACSCGSCGEKRLDVCGCPTAQGERAFIHEQLRNGRSEIEAAEALQLKYGGLKS